ncbi:hypothetical protein QYE76_012661 [Lolium multiflorum]|uniref:CCHC-type domain-containing protein n=1 Tax=Lolium multiflorum TaxID=4521 RepID=A0AAD8U1C9_LOLMU|nr:hypothetical protein QYE76_012661 [Lolium multiflorum]
MSVGSDNPATSELTSYYCMNCDTRHGLGSSDTPFICNAYYSSGEDSIDSITQGDTRRVAPLQVYVANRGDEDRTPRSSRRASFENSASNNNSDHTIAEEEWAAAKAAVLNDTPLPAGTTVGTLNAYRSILEKNHMASSINFNQFLEKEKLKSNGSNFTDWFRHVRIFLNGGNLQYVLDAPLGDPPETETDEVKNVYMTRKTRYSQVQCAILCSLESDLQKRFEHHDPHELIKELKTIFETHAAVECYEASKHFFSCMMEEGSSISEHMLVMTGHAKKLSDLGIVIPNRLGINRVLQSLPPSYKNFVMNYNMQNMNKEFPELFGMLKAAEIEIKKEHQVLMVNKTTSFKKQGKSKGKNKKSGKKAATPPVKPKSGPKPDAECYYCKEKGHWKRNCSKYLADLKSGLIKKKKEASWASSKQCTVAKSSTESEYIAASEASSEAVWMKRFIVELGVVPSALDPFVIYCDNMGAIANAQEPRQASNSYHHHHHPPQHQVQQAQPHQPNEAFPPPRGQMSMIHKTGVSRREMKKLTREINLAESVMANIPEYVEWSSQNITFSRADHPMTIPKPGHAALVVEAQIGGFKMSKVFMDGGSGINLIFLDTIQSMGITMRMLEESDTRFHGILPTSPAYSLGKAYLNVVFGKPDNFRKEKIEFEVVNWESQYHAILGRPAYAKFMAV